MADQEEDQGITAYHGSPHEFEQFDLSRIGTGEGAQSYGHGLYFAESEPIAKHYRDALAYPADPRNAINDVIRQFKDYKVDEPTHENVKNWIKDISSLKSYVNDENITKRIHGIINAEDDDDAFHHYRELDNLLPPPSKGHMYEVSINAHPDHFLDWDKPFDEQSPHVKKTLTKLVGSGELRPAIMNLKGENIHSHIQSKIGGGPEQASQFLHDKGIKGIKYLDAGSRGKGDGTRNYVVFDDKLVNVKRRYAQGGRIGYADGGSPSIGQRISEYAETLPTAEENIETIKQFGRNVGESALDFGKRIYSGFEKMAERALERPPAPTVRAGERPVYVEPKREVQPQRLYVLPDGRRVSGAELEMHNEMMRERFEEQYAMPPVVQEGMPSPKRPAPTRAPMRERLERQEQQANVNRPVVMPERKGFDWPQVYKDIMSDEPQMEWTKGMTPREQPAPAPVQTAEGSIFSTRESDGRESGIQMSGGSNASGPLEVNVTKTIVEPKYEDVYLGTGDTPNPFHSAQTMVAPAPEYEGQVVPIPDTPADRMGEYHLPRLIWPLHDLKYKKGYKAKQGLEDYNPPMSATGERFPNQGDVNFYRDVDAYYGRPEAGYLQQGARGSYYDDLTEMTSRKGGYRREMTPQESDAFKAAYIAAQRNPIAALGFRPEEFDFSGDPIPQTTAGSVLGPSSRIYADLKFPSVAVHEAIHRGLMEIRNEDYNAYLAKTDNLLKEMNDLTKQRYSPEMQNRIFQISNELDRLHENKTDPDIFPPGQVGDPEEKVDEQELFVRSLMYKMFGPVEAYEMERQLVNGDVIKKYPQEKLERFMSDNADRITRLEQRAMKMLQERQREGGPRASGGAVRKGYAIGGNPGDMATGGYGTGISGVTGSVDRNVAAGGTESNFSGGNDSGGYSGYGGDGGRDYGGSSRDSSSSMDRSTSGDGGRDFEIGGPQGLTGAPAFGRPELGTDTYNLDNAPPMTVGARLAASPNLGADLVKDAVTPDFNEETRESWLAKNYPESPRLGGMAQPVPAAPFATRNRSGSMGTMPIGTTPHTADLTPLSSQPARPITPTPFSSFSQDVQKQMIPVRSDESFGKTLIDPTGKYTQEALKNWNLAEDATTMLNSPTLAGSFMRGVAALTKGIPPATPEQQADIDRLYQRTYGTGQASSGTSVRENFDQAFANARAEGKSIFTWTNPKTGQTSTYTTQLGRRAGGRVPSLKEPEQWIAETEKPRSVAKTTKPRKPSKMSGTAIVERALMLSSRKS